MDEWTQPTGRSGIDRRRIAFLNPDAMGDLVLRQPLFRAVAADGNVVVLVVRPGLVTLAERLVPDAIIVPLPTDAYDPVVPPSSFHMDQVVEELRSLQVDMAVIAPFQRTRFDELVVEGLAGVESVGFAGHRYPAGAEPAQDPTWSDRLSRVVVVDEHEHESLKNHRLAEAIVGHPVAWAHPHLAAAAREIDEARRLLGSHALSWPTFHVACLGSSDRLSGRSWLAERWAAVLRHATRTWGWRFVLVGTPDERAGNRKMMELLEGEGVVFIDSVVTLDALLGLLALSSGYVGRDSGPMHLAAAFGRPVLSVTGGGTWPRFVPLTPVGAMFSLHVPCSGCGWFCHLDEFYCVTNVPVEPVLAAVDSLAAGTLSDMAAQALPRSERLGEHMERVAARNGRSHMWTLQRASLLEAPRREDMSRAGGDGLRPRVFLGMPFYGAGNIGDDFALAGFLEEWNRLGNPADLTAAIPFPRGSQARRFPAIEWLADEPEARDAAIRGCNAWLGLGGSPFQTDCGPWMLDTLARDAATCRRYGVPMFFLGTGVNDRQSLDDPRARETLAHASYLWMRDADCARWAAEIVGADKVATAADCAHIFLAQMALEKLEPRRLGWAMAFENESRCANDTIERTIEGLQEWRHDWLVQDVRCLPGGERWRHRRLGDVSRRAARLCVPDYDSATAAALLTNWPASDVLVSSRYHALLVGAWRGSRLVAVQRNDKLAAAARSLGCRRLERIDDADRLRAAIDAATTVDRQILHALAAAAADACRAFVDRLSRGDFRVSAGSETATGSVEFGTAFDGGGWHQAERDETSSFRWMGERRTAWVDVAVPAGGANRLHCDVAHVIRSGIERQVHLLVDGEPVATHLGQGEAGWRIDAELSPLEAGRVVRVEFVSSEAIRPCDLDASSADTRRLAIAVRRLQLSQANSHG